jgi:hypothetical protein
VVWALAAFLAAGVLALCASKTTPAWAGVWNACGGLLILVFYLSTATHAVRFGVESRRNGLMELLLVSPVSVSEIVLGQWRAVIRLFGLPVAFCLVVQLAGNFMAQNLEWKRFQAAGTAAATKATNPAVAVTTTTTVNNVTVVVSSGAVVPAASTNVTVPRPAPTVIPSPLFTLATSASGTVIVLANLVALVWFGMWMGMTAKTSNQAALRTLLFVQVIPWFIVTVCTAALVTIVMMPMVYKKAAFKLASNPMVEWFPLLMAATGLVLCLAKDLVFSLWARRKVYREFRQRSLGQVEAISVAAPPLLRPPIIAAASGTDGKA